jgi:predicted TIM-barrel fold metal-dependent hydrolase
MMGLPSGAGAKPPCSGRAPVPGKSAGHQDCSPLVGLPGSAGPDESLWAGAIDVHCHFGLGGGPPPWSVSEVLDFAANHGVAVSLLSLPFSPHARRVNEEGARLVAEHPTRLGLLASLPLNDPGVALAEVAYALDELGADGVAITTHYDGLYLGHPRYDPVFAELDRRAATVFLHPRAPLGLDALACGRSGPLLEYALDTARCVVDMLFARRFLRYPNLRMIVAHAGGPVATLSERVAQLGPLEREQPLTAGEVRAQLAGLYYDTAMAAHAAALLPVLQVTSPEHLVYGSDFPPATVPVIEANRAGLAHIEGLSPRQRRAIDSNAAALFPRLAGLAAHARPALASMGDRPLRPGL